MALLLSPELKYPFGTLRERAESLNPLKLTSCTILDKPEIAP
jgi:hypothetical protein